MHFTEPTKPTVCCLQVMWAVCVYMEAVSVLPQLRMMQNSKVVERFTAHYVFCLGLSRFFSCAHWILQLLEGNKYLLNALGSGLWPIMVLLSEIVQTFILADFWWVREGGLRRGVLGGNFSMSWCLQAISLEGEGVYHGGRRYY